MEENVAQSYAESLETAAKPHLVLAGLYRVLFGRTLQNNEWGILQKYIKIYGRWIVYEAMIRTAASPTLDETKPIWAYLNTIALSMLNEQRKIESDRKLRDQELDRTAVLIQQLREIGNISVQVVATLDHIKAFDCGNDSQQLNSAV